MTKRFLLTVVSLVVLGIGAGIAVFLAKGYRLSTRSNMVFGTGILSITSNPDQASVYLDGHLTTATNANINSLEPKDYDVKITKDGFIAWQKKVEVKQGLVSEIKATLFPAIPSVYPLTYNGAQGLTLSPDGERAAFIVTGEDLNNPLTSKKNGLWVWDMKNQPVAFARGQEPHQILSSAGGFDLSSVTLRWSPDSTQILATLPDRSLLLDASRLNDAPRDITALVKSTLAGWDQDKKTADIAQLATIKDLKVRSEASAAAYLKWSADETKILYSVDGKLKYKVADLTEKKTYDMPDGTNFSWLADSRHVIFTEMNSASPSPVATPLIPEQKEVTKSNLSFGRVAIVEFDGGNKSILYAGQFDPTSVFSWPDASRLVMVSSVPTPTASTPNLFGINLK